MVGKIPKHVAKTYVLIIDVVLRRNKSLCCYSFVFLLLRYTLEQEQIEDRRSVASAVTGEQTIYCYECDQAVSARPSPRAGWRLGSALGSEGGCSRGKGAEHLG